MSLPKMKSVFRIYELRISYDENNRMYGALETIEAAGYLGTIAAKTREEALQELWQNSYWNTQYIILEVFEKE